MRKFLNVDILDSLRAIMERNTQHYQNDFDYDVRMIQKCAASADPEDKCLLWMSRTSGTWCLRERDVFIKDSQMHNTWLAYGSDKNVLAFAAEIVAVREGAVLGYLYQLDYPRHIEHVQKTALPIDGISVTYKDGHAARFASPHAQAKARNESDAHGGVATARFEVADESDLQRLLQSEHKDRRRFPQRTMQGFIQILNRDPPPAAMREKLEQAQRRDDAQPRGGGQNRTKGEPQI